MSDRGSDDPTSPRAAVRVQPPEHLSARHDASAFQNGTHPSLADALRRCLAASEIAGVRAVVAHAIDDDAVQFYQRHGFLRSTLGERVMLLPIEAVRAVFQD